MQEQIVTRESRDIRNENPIFNTGFRSLPINQAEATLQPPLELRQETDWHDFSSISNPPTTPLAFNVAMRDALTNNTTKYTPDGEAHNLRTSLARIFNLQPNCFLCGASVYDMLRAVTQTYQPCTVGIQEPSRRDYSLAATNSGHQIIDLTNPSGFIAPDPDIVNMYGMSFDAAILSNPSFPTSRLLSESTLRKYLDVCKWVIVDERSIELTLEGESFIRLINEYRNLIIIRSLGETFALSGIPISYCAADARTISQISKFFDTSSVSMFAEILSPIIANENKYLSQTKDLLEQEIPWMQCMLNLIPGVSIFPAEANYVMCEYVNDTSMDLRIRDIKELSTRLQLNGFLINPIENIPGLSDNRYFTVAVKTRKENELLIKELKYLICNR